MTINNFDCDDNEYLKEDIHLKEDEKNNIVLIAPFKHKN